MAQTTERLAAILDYMKNVKLSKSMSLPTNRAESLTSSIKGVLVRGVDTPPAIVLAPWLTTQKAKALRWKESSLRKPSRSCDQPVMQMQSVLTLYGNHNTPIQ